MGTLAPFVSMALAWIAPALLSVTGATLAWRAIRALVRRRQRRCHRCGQRLAGGSWTTEVCSECGAQRSTPIARWCTALIVLGLALQWPLVARALPIPGREMLLFITAL